MYFTCNQCECPDHERDSAEHILCNCLSASMAKENFVDRVQRDVADVAVDNARRQRRGQRVTVLCGCCYYDVPTF